MKAGERLAAAASASKLGVNLGNISFDLSGLVLTIPEAQRGETVFQ